MRIKSKTENVTDVINKTEDLLRKCSEQVQVNPLPLCPSKLNTTSTWQTLCSSPTNQLGLMFLTSTSLKTRKTLRFLTFTEVRGKKSFDSKSGIHKNTVINV